MIWPNKNKIIEWRQSGKMRRSDELFWEGDRKLYDFWLHCIIQRLEKEDGKKTKS